MRKILLLFVTLLASLSAWADVEINETNFPDANFRNWLLAQETGEDGILTDEEIVGVYFGAIQVGGMEIADLTGIAFFTALEDLECYENHLTTLDVSHNTALAIGLDCSDNQLTSLNVSNNPNLTSINCQNNHLTSLDVSSCTALRHLNIYCNQIYGEAMDSLIASLPTRPENSVGYFRVADLTSVDELNVITTTQVAAARAKNWIVQAWMPQWLDYDGVAPDNEVIEVTAGGVKFNMIKVDGNDDNDISTFYIGECEVTEALWLAVMGGENPSSNPGNLEDKLPVENISWNDCQAFLTKLNQMTGLTFRLPTAAEWMWAAKGGNKSHGYTYSGSNNINEVAWYNGNCSSKQTVGTKAPNELGIHDMSGNVYEIVHEATGVYGGGWHAPAGRCGVTYYYSANEAFTDNDTGFRLALTSVLKRGDINGDNKVDVSDVNIIINIMLGKAQASEYPGNPDLNNDTHVDVSDVNAVINIMLGKE